MWLIILIIIIVAMAIYLWRNPWVRERWFSPATQAVCVLEGDGEYKGVINGVAKVSSRGRGVIMDVNMRGVPSGMHGFHLHEFGDLRDGCTSAGEHYNPLGRPHGGLRGRQRHRGDFGNLRAEGGEVNQRIIVEGITVPEMIGRTLVVHADVDDLGASGDPTGRSGARIACGIVGLAGKN